MREIRTETEIAAGAPAVWAILTDFARYPEWNPLLERVTADLRPGAPVALTVRLGGRALRAAARMGAVVPGREFRWIGPPSRLQAAVFRADHFFRVEPVGADACRFHHGEDFTGLALPLLDRWMRRTIVPGYAAMNAALKARVERACRDAAAGR